MIRVLLVDDETLLRTALASLLSLSGEIEIVAQAADGLTAVALAETCDPDVIVLDLEMPGIDGIETVRRIIAARPAQAVVMLTRHGRAGVLRMALAAGVRGFLLKSVDPTELERVIIHVHSGKRWIDAEVSAAAMTDDCPLTDRELDTLRLTTEGLSVREISTRLHLASGTIRNYLSSAMQKTGGSSRHAAARVARERGWL
ncbi:two component transcriptional regulator, LuxR family [Catenulispora acidiphila DSM 44928]|uniref:Two component transcriptional regulator, LuxR family n=1 Tax=Catenulispora acidiphila (strain DSM 44928 / JCM 14897 / NBRC 102108 / NRRL B-24433 / ID139908) TaxID=479433 RepID=C7QEC6_CATAD|nr:response regulator transcription factor [Catenulispora acidiphila]ACU70817.1 two component transcriptional regulator, LuxR family [Catenulispora acidiphila DSM 44928]